MRFRINIFHLIPEAGRWELQRCSDWDLERDPFSLASAVDPAHSRGVLRVPLFLVLGVLETTPFILFFPNQNNTGCVHNRVVRWCGKADTGAGKDSRALKRKRIAFEISIEVSFEFSAARFQKLCDWPKIYLSSIYIKQNVCVELPFKANSIKKKSAINKKCFSQFM